MGSQAQPLGSQTLQIEDYAIIGDMRTCALVGKNGSIDFLCWPHFDSPSFFARLLDTERGGGGHWRIHPRAYSVCKQHYVAATNILTTKWIHEDGVVNTIDYFAINGNPRAPRQFTGLTTLVRTVKCVRGTMKIDIELAPGPGYGKLPANYTVSDETHGENSIRQYIHPDVHSKDQGPSFIVAYGTNGHDIKSKIQLFRKNPDNNSWTATVELREGQEFSMLMSDRQIPAEVDNFSLEELYNSTLRFWSEWIRCCKYRGKLQQDVERSLLILKLLTFDETGAIVAAPTFSLPEAIGGARNWDYRYSWIRDSSFTVYVFLKMGFRLEAEAYMRFIFERIAEWKDRPDQKHLPLMFGIRGETDLPEEELSHLGGYRDSKPVRIGNAATEHVQLDIYGELMDAIYLFDKHGQPVSYQQWLAVRHLADFVCTVWRDQDMSIWEVRGGKSNFTYSKIMLWVAIDRSIRLANKRNLPCPNRLKWMEVRDMIYEEVMERGFNKQMNSFVQSYESNTTLDAAVLIAPLVFFISPNDPYFTGTLDRIRESPERGGLTSAGFVFRYNHATVDDGVGGREGTFVMCTFWLIEALVRAGKYNQKYLTDALGMFEDVTNFRNHVGMLSEEIAISGEQLGNTPQAFSHLAFVSAAINLERVLHGDHEHVGH